MNDPQLYSEFSKFQQIDSEEIFRVYLKLIREKNVINDSLLDIGCGPGDTLVKKILPQLRKEPLKVVGVDISPKMIEAASEKYQSESLKFHVLDIQSDCYQATAHLASNSYDLVTSFYCYNFVRNET